jgi:hypothetical protein
MIDIFRQEEIGKSFDPELTHHEVECLFEENLNEIADGRVSK